MSTHSTSARLKVILRWIGITLLFLFLAGFAVIFFMPSDWLRNMAGTTGSALLGRKFAIDGDIKIDWDWTTPEVSIRKLRIANIAKSKDPNMVAIDEIDFQIKIWKLLQAELNLPKLKFTKPKVILEKFSEAEKNWDFPALAGDETTSEDRKNLPVIGSVSIDDGKLAYRDLPKKLAVMLNLDTARGGVEAQKGMYKLSGQGTLQDQPFSLQAKGGSLSMLQNSTAPYPLTLDIKMGSTRIDVEGTIANPAKLAGMNTQLNLQGNNLADLFHLTQIPLPPTPPYQLSGHLQQRNEVWKFNKFKGKVGDSDLSGDLVYQTKSERNFVNANLVSQKLDMDDLAGFIGAAPSKGTMSPEQKAQAEREKSSPRLLPDVPIDLTRLRATDMEVHLKGKQIIGTKWPLNDLDIGFNLQKGVLHLDPLDFGVADGTIGGSLILDGQKDVPQIQSDLMLKRLSLKPFFTDPKFESLSAGYFGGQLKVKGNGRSLAEVLATSDGRITLMMTGGKISLLIIEAAGLDLGQATPLLLGKDKSTDIRCVIGDFKVDNGLLNSEIFVFDTTDSNIDGYAHINLKDETIDAKVETHPKDISIGSARTPITVTGRLKQPTIGLDPKQLAARAAGAVVLGAFLTPVAAIIPFIELGLGKDSDCRGLIEQARSHSGTNPPIEEPKQEQPKTRPKKP
ncbi:AsmA family protein [Methylobacter sp.]|uniref:AsmA family protein n=1 Tax=Methylobacter sp. TaxID=2051955 RepID=UPI0011F55C55|nr:AsmA family protein [Methylobacter sp.]TAK63380.1 MAG: AsmA family protein [Methylobacter sp.]